MTYTGLALAVFGVCAALARVAVAAPAYGALLIGAIALVLIAIISPTGCLALGVTTSLAGGSFASLGRVGLAAVVAGGSVLIVRGLRQEAAQMPTKPLLLTTVLATWLGFRLFFDSGLTALRLVGLCYLVVMALLFSDATSRDKLVRWMAWLGVVFVLVSVSFGVTSGLDNRFVGISGNPNRMVFGVLIFGSFALHGLIYSKSWFERVAFAAGLGGGGWLILASGSSQGIAGAAVLALIVVVYISRNLDYRIAVFWTVLAIALCIWITVGSELLSSMSDDLRTLSGRTSLYDLGWESFMAEPIFGSGELHVTDDLGQSFSTHNSILGVAASAGLPAVAAWLLMTAWCVTSSLRGVRNGRLYLGCGVLVGVLQTVQSVEYFPLAWAALLLPIAVAQGEPSND
ncbi:hypothetical protein ASE25_17220 [Terrabacter sp. Root85]|uniref:O-antigen ligase family protein n=1 Tax=Terrabacter sp. Root85 TaxID=1736603 RepID=UPI000701A866|nr:O-antigen ligase family protein [Terrabacter sp. Root85]KRC87471.1 hypothetical protein ASE25_17220 [Terrabacter sp. Root85]